MWQPRSGVCLNLLIAAAAAAAAEFDAGFDAARVVSSAVAPCAVPLVGQELHSHHCQSPARKAIHHVLLTQGNYKCYVQERLALIYSAG